jgi:hypothetical protein
MKSFADWTQELAESVGEVKHHWEDPAPKTEQIFDIESLDGYLEDTITPSWQAPGAPIPATAPPPPPPQAYSSGISICDGCSSYGDPSTEDSKSSTDSGYSIHKLCQYCRTKYNYVPVRKP